jgi:hypothetical protein
VRIGIDLDNTIACYDEVFPLLARERALIPADVPLAKAAVRDYLRRVGQEERWTELQGEVYGPEMVRATPFPGAFDFLKRCQRAQIPVVIVSHRSRHPYRGPNHDLHSAARQWLVAQGLHDPDRIGLPADSVYLEVSKRDKLARIAELGCTHFVDDLPELLADPDFPATVSALLFDPHDVLADRATVRRLTSWAAIGAALLPPE